MIVLNFVEYESGFVRAYFKDDKGLYCVQAGHHFLPELLICSRDGEPSHQVENGLNYCFNGFDGDTRWTWMDILSYFYGCEENSELMRRMNELFGE